MALTIDRVAWIAGFRAGASGKDGCPYKPGSTQAWSWQSGFIEGTAKREGHEYSTGTLTLEEL